MLPFWCTGGSWNRQRRQPPSVVGPAPALAVATVRAAPLTVAAIRSPRAGAGDRLASMDQEKVDGLVFSSNFDSGNLQSAERAKDGAWELTIAKDCEGTEFERRSSTWFYFRVRDERESELSIAKRDKRGARFRFTGMSRQGALYKNGMRPVVRRLNSTRHHRR